MAFNILLINISFSAICAAFLGMLLQASLKASAYRKYTSEEVHKLLNKVRSFSSESERYHSDHSGRFSMFSFDVVHGTKFSVVFLSIDKNYLNKRLVYHTFPHSISFSKHYWECLKFAYFLYFKPITKMPLHLNDSPHRSLIATWRLEIGK